MPNGFISVEETDQKLECIKEECMWWIEENREVGAPSECSIVRIARAGSEIQWNFGQFRFERNR